MTRASGPCGPSPAGRTRAAPAAVLFDAAGTLIALREPVGATYSAFAERQGTHVPPDRLEEAFRRVLRAAPPNAHPALPERERPAAERAWWRARVRESFRAADQMVRIPDFEALFDALFRHYATPAAWQLRRGAREALEALRAAGVRCAVLSNFDHRLPPLLQALGVAAAFEFVLLPLHTGTAKPDPAFFQAALERLDLPAERVVYLGDDPDDDHAGAAAAGLAYLDATRLESLAELPARLGISAIA